jgi:uncharacterized RDD family membrane protein YckC
VTQPTYESAPPPPEGSYSSGPSGPRSGFWRRFAAFVIDGLIVGVVEFLIRLGLGEAAYLTLGTIISLGYGTYFEGSAGGATPGKMALGIRVYDFRQGGSIGYGRALIRQLVKIVSAIPLFLGYFWMLWDKENQCWQDKIASDVVVPTDAYR